MLAARLTDFWRDTQLVPHGSRHQPLLCCAIPESGVMIIKQERWFTRLFEILCKIKERFKHWTIITFSSLAMTNTEFVYFSDYATTGKNL